MRDRKAAEEPKVAEAGRDMKAVDEGRLGMWAAGRNMSTEAVVSAIGRTTGDPVVLV